MSPSVRCDCRMIVSRERFSRVAFDNVSKSGIPKYMRYVKRVVVCIYIYYARGRSGRRRKENRGRFIKVPLAGATPFYYMLNVDLGISRRGADPSRGALSRPLVPCWALSPFLIVRTYRPSPHPVSPCSSSLCPFDSCLSPST